MNYILLQWNTTKRIWEVIHYTHDWNDLMRMYELKGGQVFIKLDDLNTVANKLIAKQIYDKIISSKLPNK